jgi:hypothetical protein
MLCPTHDFIITIISTGAITGSVFGFMDGLRTAGESKVLQNASNMAKGKYILQGTTRSATMFGGTSRIHHVALQT